MLMSQNATCQQGLWPPGTVAEYSAHSGRGFESCYWHQVRETAMGLASRNRRL